MTYNITKLNNSLIRARRIEKQFSQDRLSELTGISRSQIQRIESNSVNDIKIKTLLKLCHVLDLKIEDIIIEKEGDTHYE